MNAGDSGAITRPRLRSSVSIPIFSQSTMPCPARATAASLGPVRLDAEYQVRARALQHLRDPLDGPCRIQSKIYSAGLQDTQHCSNRMRFLPEQQRDRFDACDLLIEYRSRNSVGGSVELRVRIATGLSDNCRAMGNAGTCFEPVANRLLDLPDFEGTNSVRAASCKIICTLHKCPVGANPTAVSGQVNPSIASIGIGAEYAGRPEPRRPCSSSRPRRPSAHRAPRRSIVHLSTARQRDVRDAPRSTRIDRESNARRHRAETIPSSTALSTSAARAHATSPTRAG